MITTTDEHFSSGGLLLEMALEAQAGVARQQHLFIHGAVSTVTRRATFAHSFMLEHERPRLSGVAFPARLRFSGQRCSAADDRIAFVRIVAV